MRRRPSALDDLLFQMRANRLLGAVAGFVLGCFIGLLIGALR